MFTTQNRLTCSNGHRWQPATPDPAAQTFTSVCPTCGAASLSPLAAPPLMLPILGALEVVLLGVGFWLLMYQDLIWSLVPLGTAAAIPLLLLWLIYEGRRIRNLMSVGRDMKFTFAGQIALSSLQGLGYFQLFTDKRAPLACHGLEGHIQDRHVVLFEFRHQTGGSRSSWTRKYTVVLFPNGAVGHANRHQDPQSFWSQIGHLLRSDLPEQYWNTTHEANWGLEIQNGHLLLYRLGRCSVQECPGLIREACKIATHLKQEHSGPR